MIKRLKLFRNEAQTDLQNACINKKHDRIKFITLRKIYRKCQSFEYTKLLLNQLKQNIIKSSNNEIKIKSLIVLHYLIKKSMFSKSQIVQFAEQQLSEIKTKMSLKGCIGGGISLINGKIQKVVAENQQKEYIKKNIIEFYILYLLKFILHETSYNYAKNVTEGSKEIFPTQKLPQFMESTTCDTKIQQTSNLHDCNQENSLHALIMQKITHGFQIINLINFIISSQDAFNKMGRYYIESEEILNLFIMYLDDLTIYNNYIKRTAKQLTKSINQFKEEEIKHCFLFITESQKTSDRLYEFYYNRYYYAKVKKLITLPTFLTIENSDFERVVKQVKRVDKQLLLKVKESKYSKHYNEKEHNKTMFCLTEASKDQKSNIYSRINQTMVTEMGSDKRQKFNKSLSTIENMRHKTKEQIEENITQYIECFEDIDDEEFI